MTVDEEDDMVVVSRAAGAGPVTKGTLLSLLRHVHRCDADEAAEMITTAREQDVLEEVRPGVLRVTEERLSNGSGPEESGTE